MDYVALANDQDIRKVRYVLRKDSGQVNKGYAAYSARLVGGKIKFTWESAERPRFEYVVFGGAVVEVYEIDEKRDRYYIRMLEVGGEMPSVKLFPPIQRFRSIDQFDNLATLPYNGVLFCKAGDKCWLPGRLLKKL